MPSNKGFVMKKCIILSILAAGAICVFWFFYALQSYLVMSIYSGQHSKHSVMRKNGFQIEMPSSPGWYPFVMTYNADGFSGWSGINADMSIMYNFGAFDAATRTSLIYQRQSDKYSSFYGAYAVKKNSGVFGFLDGDIDLKEVTLAVRYDYTKLVMQNFGCNEQVFAVNDCCIEKDLDYAGSSGWTRIDAFITANGAAHIYRENKTAYLQYGPPVQKPDEDFALISLYGRIYAKYFDEYDCTVMIYVIAPTADAVNSCDNAILRKTKIMGL